MNAMDVALICKALGDANRLEIVQMLSDGEKCGCKLLERFEITQPTLSHDEFSGNIVANSYLNCCICLKIKKYLMSLPHLPTSANFHQDIILHIQEDHQWRVRLMHSLILMWFLSPFQLPNSQCGAYSQQRYKHQYCCAWDCILQILFSSYQISLSLNQSFVAKIRSISISSPCHFYFVLYCFIGFSWSPLPLFVPLWSVQSQHPLDVVKRSAQSRCSLDILCPCICPCQSS